MKRLDESLNFESFIKNITGKIKHSIDKDKLTISETGQITLKNENNRKDFIIDDLKCCGNCVYRTFTCNSFCVEENCFFHSDEIISSNGICPDWKFDDLNYTDRLNEI